MNPQATFDLAEATRRRRAAEGWFRRKFGRAASIVRVGFWLSPAECREADQATTGGAGTLDVVATLDFAPV
jgi:hypothetical protein